MSEAQRLELELGCRHGKKHCFRMRCLAVLLKADSMSAAKVGKKTEMVQHTMSKWLKQYEKEDIKGLKARPSWGRKPIMDCSDEEAVRRAIEQDGQSVNKAREA